MIVDKKILAIDTLAKKVVTWYITRFKYHIDLRYNGKDILTEQPVNVKVYKHADKVPEYIYFEPVDRIYPLPEFNEVILIREPKFLYFGKFVPVIVYCIDEVYVVSTNGKLAFKLTL